MRKIKSTMAVLAAAGMLLSFTACSGTGTPGTSSTSGAAKSSAPASASITVFAAASLTESFTEIGQQIKKEDNIDVKFSFEGSQQLEAAVEQGTPADVVAYASESYIKTAKTKGYVDNYQIFAKNTLVACKLKTNPKKLINLADLSKPGVSLIVGAKAVPCGAYFLTVLNASALTADQKAKVMANIKSNETDVKDVLAKVQSGNGDFGIVYATDITKSVQDQVEAVTVPEFSAAKPLYPISVLKGSKNREAAQKFVDYVMSAKGQAILKSYKFITNS